MSMDFYLVLKWWLLVCTYIYAGSYKNDKSIIKSISWIHHELRVKNAVVILFWFHEISILSRFTLFQNLPYLYKNTKIYRYFVVRIEKVWVFLLCLEITRDIQYYFFRKVGLGHSFSHLHLFVHEYFKYL